MCYLGPSPELCETSWLVSSWNLPVSASLVLKDSTTTNFPSHGFWELNSWPYSWKAKILPMVATYLALLLVHNTPPPMHTLIWTHIHIHFYLLYTHSCCTLTLAVHVLLDPFITVTVLAECFDHSHNYCPSATTVLDNMPLLILFSSAFSADFSLWMVLIRSFMLEVVQGSAWVPLQGTRSKSFYASVSLSETLGVFNCC